jgi:hypothetical protein
VTSSKTFLTGASQFSETAKGSAWSRTLVCMVNHHESQLRSLYLPVDHIPVLNHPWANSQATRNHPCSWNLPKIFKIANPKLFPLPCLTFPWRDANKGFGIALVLTPIFYSWLPWCLLHLALHGIHACRTCECSKLSFPVPPLSLLVTAPHWPSHKRRQNIHRID